MIVVLFFKNQEWDILPFDGTLPNEEDFALFLERLKGFKNRCHSEMSFMLHNFDI